MWTRKSLPLTLLAAGAAALLGTACGDDGGSTPNDATTDSSTPPVDSSTPPVDGPTPPVDAPTDGTTSTGARSGTITVLDLQVTTPGIPGNPGGDDLGLRGGSVNILFNDPSEATGNVVFGTEPAEVGKCVVTAFKNGTNSPRMPRDEGKITITGAGLLKPVGECALSTDLGAYECTVKNGTTEVEIKVRDAAAGIFTVTLTGDFGSTNYVASHLRLSGFDEVGFNRTFPVVQKVSQNGTSITVAVIVPKGTTTATEEKKTGIAYSFLGGFGPIPTAPVNPDANADFLGDNKPAAEPVTIKKTASTALKEREVTLEPLGDGFQLVGTQAHEFPFTSTAVTFNCGNKCGAAAAGTTVLIVSGITTDVPLPPTLRPFFMPPPEASDQYATFQCIAVLDLANPQGVTLPKEAVDAILATMPTRIETRVYAATTESFEEGTSKLTVLVGHGVVGHTSEL